MLISHLFVCLHMLMRFLYKLKWGKTSTHYWTKSPYFHLPQSQKGLLPSRKGHCHWSQLQLCHNINLLTSVAQWPCMGHFLSDKVYPSVEGRTHRVWKKKPWIILSFYTLHPVSITGTWYTGKMTGSVKHTQGCPQAGAGGDFSTISCHLCPLLFHNFIDCAQ